MTHIVVFGPVGTGRSTLAKVLAEGHNLANHDDIVDGGDARRFLTEGGVGVLHAADIESARLRLGDLAGEPVGTPTPVGSVLFIPAPLHPTWTSVPQPSTRGETGGVAA